MEFIKAKPRVIVYNTVAEPQYNSFRTIQGFSNLAKALKENPSIFRINYIWDGTLDQKDDFTYVAGLAYACKSITFHVEEISLFCNPMFVPRPLAKIISIGRHRDLSFYCTSQTPKQINTLIRSQASQIISFTQTEPAHIDWCREVMGEDADKISSLKPFESLNWTPHGSMIMDKNWNKLDRGTTNKVVSHSESKSNGLSEIPSYSPSSDNPLDTNSNLEDSENGNGIT